MEIARTALDRFDAALRSADSATTVLSAWMAEPPGGAPASLVVRLRPASAGPFPTGLRERLEVSHDAEIRLRRVWLVLDGRILSEAENWYIPARLTDGMREALTASQVPFGAIVRPLRPTRETIAVARLWAPVENALLRPPSRVLHHRALMRTATGEPICEVSEFYTRNVLSGGPVPRPFSR
mgnify:FL=1